jgi:hypothetical protein
MISEAVSQSATILVVEDEQDQMTILTLILLETARRQQ